MDDEIKRLLKKNLELTKENNRLLRKMRRSAIIGNVLRIIWWSILVGAPIILYYYFLQPYVDQFSETYQGVQSGVKNLQNVGDKLPSFPGFGWLLNFGKGE